MLHAVRHKKGEIQDTECINSICKIAPCTSAIGSPKLLMKKLSSVVNPTTNPHQAFKSISLKRSAPWTPNYGMTSKQN